MIYYAPMKQLLERLHAKLGDFWWYSLTLFVASRAADVLNVFVGLYLVPKYVGTKELGAVLPLMSFAGCLAFPMTAFATVFAKEINRLATENDFGKLKTLLRGVFWAAAAFLALAVLVSHFALPHFLERIRVVKGSLGLLIIATSFVGCTAPIYANALQSLKRFGALSVINLLGAPIRACTMLVTMPFRALAGYFTGQAAPSVFTIAAAIVSLRRELAVKAEEYWTSETIRRFTMLFIGVLAYQGSTALASVIEPTVIRQRLPEVESAAYYMVTRFTDITTFLSGTLLITLFPHTAELAQRGLSTRNYVIKSSCAVAVFNAALAVFFAVFGAKIMGLLPDGGQYAGYSMAIPAIICVNTLTSVTGFHTATEVSAARFGFLKWWIPLALLYPAFMLFVTGYGYFEPYLPETVSKAVKAVNITSIYGMIVWGAVIAVIRMGFTLLDLARQDRAAAAQPNPATV